MKIDRQCITMSTIAETNESWELCEKPEQSGFWCVGESGSKYLDRRLRRRTSRTGSASAQQKAALVVEERSWRRPDSVVLDCTLLLRYAGPRWWWMACIKVAILNSISFLLLLYPTSFLHALRYVQFVFNCVVGLCMKYSCSLESSEELFQLVCPPTWSFRSPPNPHFKSC